MRNARFVIGALIVLSAGSAFLLSCAALFAGRSDIYFETAAGLVTILWSLAATQLTALFTRAMTSVTGP